MSRHIRALLNQVISTAKASGISQAKLAQRVGLSAVGLSKAKSRGDIRASTLQELGAQFDLELVFVPRRSTQKAAEAIKSGAFFHTGGTAEDKDN